MSELPVDVPEGHEPPDLQEFQAGLRRLERRDWWLWWAAVIVMFLLTAAVVSLSLPVLLREGDAQFRANLRQSVRGLVALIALFNFYTIYQQVLIKRLRNQLAVQLSLGARLHMRALEFQKLAMLDPLTGLHNRRFAENRLAAEAKRAVRHGSPLTLLAIDLDDFKYINDRYGHSAGDQVLREFAQSLNQAIRGSDLAVRMGGDEFCVLLPDCTASQVQHVLSRLTPLEFDLGGKKLSLTFSAGWADFRAGEDFEKVHSRADHALYANKRSGKSPLQLIASAQSSP